jgi:HK97 family phage prohead protease
MDKTKRRGLFVEEVKDANDAERSIIHFITTEHVDRYGDIVRADGMNDSLYGKNPVVLYGHDYRAFPVGKSLWRKVGERDGVKGVLTKTQFADTPEGNQVYGLWKDGFLNASSIGFIPTEWETVTRTDEAGNTIASGWDIKAWELLEYSIVPVPANGNALRLALEKGLAEQVAGPIQEAVREHRLCELEECRKGMDSLPATIEALKAEVKQMADASIEREVKIKELETKLTAPKVESVATLSGDDLKKIVNGLVSGTLNRMRGRVD